MRLFLNFYALLIFLALFLSPQLFAAEPFFTKERKVMLAASREFPERGKDFSGAAYFPQTGHYLVLDDSCQIFEVEYSDGWLEAVRGIKVKGLKDCEDIAVLPDAGLAVTEERRGNLAFFRLPGAQEKISCPEDCRIFHLDKVRSLKRPNAGLEALAVNGPILYAGKEEYPRKIYRLTFQNKSYKPVVPWDAEEKLPKGSDVAGMVYFEGALFILDERGETVRQVEPASGNILSAFTLPHFTAPSHKYEGIAMARKGKTVEMLIAAEKSEIQVYRIEKIN